MIVILEYDYGKEEFIVHSSKGVTHDEIIAFIERFLTAAKVNGITPHLSLVKGGAD